MKTGLIGQKATVQFFIFMDTRITPTNRSLLLVAGFFLMMAFCLQSARAETIVLRSRRVIEAPILEKADTYIIIDDNGRSAKYDLSDIETIIDDSYGYGEVFYPVIPEVTAVDFRDKADVDDLISKERAGISAVSGRSLTSQAPMSNSEQFNRAETMMEGVQEDFDKHFLNR